MLITEASNRGEVKDLTEWGVVGVVTALVGLFVTVVKPLLTLNTSIVRLTERMEHLSTELSELTVRNTEKHKRIWSRVDEQAELLADHEKRIDQLESEGRNR